MSGAGGMLSLESPRWAELRHAYGPASDTPDLLRQLRTMPPGRPDDWRSEPWQSLWSSLCHQGDVYTASYAAVPHLAALAHEKSLPERFGYVSLIAFIEVGRHRRTAPPIPPELDERYFSALTATSRLALECLALNWTAVELRYLLGSLAVCRGEAELGFAIMDPLEEIECPACGTMVPISQHEFW